MRWIALVLVMMACDKTTPESNTSGPGGTPEGGTTGAPPATNTTPSNDPGMAGEPGGMDTPNMATTPASLTDAQIAHVLQTANQAEVADGKEAANKATKPEVKAFASQMVTDHGGADDKLKALATQKAMTPETNPVSENMKLEHSALKSKVDAAQGPAYDAAYVDTQVILHEKTLDTIDQVLLPNVDDPELKAFITTVRPTIAAHLDHARAMQQTLGTGGAPTGKLP